mmetsp:Transcript_14432/g.31809  ORF Transcript_14432/g.31809 Transcript_14432/m.31809 type:complete len:196 (+) Transcript_14432:825-1412(+)
MWVGAFTHHEAFAYFDHWSVLLTDGETDCPNSQLRRRFLDETTANAQILKVACNCCNHARAAADAAVEALPDNSTEDDRQEARWAAERGAVEQRIEMVYKSANLDVRTLLQSKYGVTAEQLMRLLLKSPGSPGVSVGDSDGEMIFIDSELAQAVKVRNHCALCYDSEAMLCQFYSPAHERAARACFEGRERLGSR